MLLDYFNRLEFLDHLIRSKSTGDPTLLSKRLGISKRTLFDFLGLMRDLGAPIAYCKDRKSYIYTKSGKFPVRFQFDAAEEVQEEMSDVVSVKKTISRIIASDIPITSDIILMLCG